MAAVSKNMSIEEVVMKWPKTMDIFMEFGLHCIGCMASRFENIEQGAMAHGIPVDELIDALNKVADEK
jgi:hybrid cluster-associated redox disulfide protein